MTACAVVLAACQGVTPTAGMMPKAGCPAASYGARFYALGGAKTVALTFDDGPGQSTAAILAILARYRVPATFFNIGVNMAARPSLVRAEVKASYAMGNHAWNYPDLDDLTAAQQAAELDEATDEQRSITGTVPCAFRPLYGDCDPTTLRLAQQHRMGVWLWSVDTQDWMAKGSGSPACCSDR
jgi:peptidoglycan-N-acetylglucosamine deacetylase